MNTLGVVWDFANPESNDMETKSFVHLQPLRRRGEIGR